VDFDWDETKRSANLEKHGVDFVEIAQILEGPVMNRVDRRRDYGEVRIISTGALKGVVYVLVHTERNGITRLISAWKGGRYEREKYQARLAGRDQGDGSEG
jgi:uncharacterized DUF497 family protein